MKNEKTNSNSEAITLYVDTRTNYIKGMLDYLKETFAKELKRDIDYQDVLLIAIDVLHDKINIGNDANEYEKVIRKNILKMYDVILSDLWDTETNQAVDIFEE